MKLQLYTKDFRMSDLFCVLRRTYNTYISGSRWKRNHNPRWTWQRCKLSTRYTKKNASWNNWICSLLDSGYMLSSEFELMGSTTTPQWELQHAPLASLKSSPVARTIMHPFRVSPPGVQHSWTKNEERKFNNLCMTWHASHTFSRLILVLVR